jgi:hypothetical protein
MADVVVVCDRPQALTLADHPDSVALLVCGKLRLGTELHAPFLGCGSTTVGTRQDPEALVLRQG